MRRQGLCDSSFESQEHTDSKSIFEKSRRSRGGAPEHFVFCQNYGMATVSLKNFKNESKFSRNKFQNQPLLK